MNESSFAGTMSGKVVVVTGAGSGIGRAAVRQFAVRDARVVALDIDGDAVRETVRQCGDTPVAPLALQGNAADAADVERVFRHAQDEFGGLHAVFANAGIAGQPSTLESLTVDQLTEVLRVNVVAPFLAIQCATASMTRGGSIVLTSSVAGLRASAGSVGYSASKAAVVSLAQTGAAALAGRGIRVNAICPGLIRTAMTERAFVRAEQNGTSHRIGELNPLGRAGLPDEVAAAAVFLASDESSYINGQAISVDGGLSSTHPFASWRR